MPPPLPTGYCRAEQDAREQIAERRSVVRQPEERIGGTAEDVPAGRARRHPVPTPGEHLGDVGNGSALRTYARRAEQAVRRRQGSAPDACIAGADDRTARASAAGRQLAVERRISLSRSCSTGSPCAVTADFTSHPVSTS
jgi:hypothetical protein